MIYDKTSPFLSPVIFILTKIIPTKENKIREYPHRADEAGPLEPSSDNELNNAIITNPIKINPENTYKFLLTSSLLSTLGMAIYIVFIFYMFF